LTLDERVTQFIDIAKEPRLLQKVPNDQKRDEPVIRLDGRTLTLPSLSQVCSGATVLVDESARLRAIDGQWAAERIAAVRPLYARNTGVGANRDQPSDDDAPTDHGLAILRSHAAGWGDCLAPRSIRCALAIRANQMLAGGSGADVDLALALASLADGPEGDLPQVHRNGALGTSDLTALAEVGMTLLGERPRANGDRRLSYAMRSVDALPLMSSHAFTLADGALGCLDLQRLSQVALTVCALSWVALKGNLEAVGHAVRTVTPFPGAIFVASHMTNLLATQGIEPIHLQDFFGLRTWPQVHGPLIDRLADLQFVVETSINTSSENPVFLTGPDESAAHHGAFQAAYLALALDASLLALTRSARSGQSRIAHLLTDSTTGLPRFLADVREGSSGLLIGEYVAGSAMASIRDHASSPASVQTISISAGVEDDASFASVAASRFPPAVASYRRLLAVELVCAVRALRLRGTPLHGLLNEAFDACAGLPNGMADRDVEPDFSAAEELLDHPPLAPSSFAR
jgi:histidine ammonia-lyase